MSLNSALETLARVDEQPTQDEVRALCNDIACFLYTPAGMEHLFKFKIDDTHTLKPVWRLAQNAEFSHATIDLIMQFYQQEKEKTITQIMLLRPETVQHILLFDVDDEVLWLCSVYALNTPDKDMKRKIRETLRQKTVQASPNSATHEMAQNAWRMLSSTSKSE
jgi:hypothetical protein